MKSRITIAVLSFLLIFTMMMSNENNRIYANESRQNDIQTIEKVETISYDEAVKLLVEKEKISYADARERLLTVNNGNKIIRTSSKSVSYKTYTKTYNLTNGYTIEIGGIWQVYTSGSFRQFNANAGKWVEANGSGSYTWKTYHITDTTVSYPTTKVSLSGRGCMEIAVNTSTSSGASIGSDLLGVGFSVSKTVGTTKYYRCVKDVSLTKNLY